MNFNSNGLKSKEENLVLNSQQSYQILTNEAEVLKLFKIYHRKEKSGSINLLLDYLSDKCVHYVTGLKWVFCKNRRESMIYFDPFGKVKNLNSVHG